jgi:hypothetical protein
MWTAFTAAIVSRIVVGTYRIYPGLSGNDLTSAAADFARGGFVRLKKKSKQGAIEPDLFRGPPNLRQFRYSELWKDGCRFSSQGCLPHRQLHLQGQRGETLRTPSSDWTCGARTPHPPPRR